MCAGFQAKTVTPVSIRPDCDRATVKREDGHQVEPPERLNCSCRRAYIPATVLVLSFSQDHL